MWITFIVGVVVGMVVLTGIALLYPSHKHTLKPTAICYMTQKTRSLETGKATCENDVTQLLSVCQSCGEAVSKTYNGSWKLADFTLASAKGDVELADLRRMAQLPEKEN
jgi:hypothetical protein